MTQRTIRRARPEDVAGIVDVHIGSWRWAYRGLIPDDYLDTLEDTRRRREEMRREWVSDPEWPIRTLVALIDSQIVGFAEVRPSPDEDAAPDTGQLSAIYLAQNAAGKGIGRILLDAALDDLRARGFTQATLWVLSTNQRARRFYHATGWAPDGAEKTEEWPGGVRLQQVRYRRTL